MNIDDLLTEDSNADQSILRKRSYGSDNSADENKKPCNHNSATLSNSEPNVKPPNASTPASTVAAIAGMESEEFVEVAKSELNQHDGYRTSHLMRSFAENDPDDVELTLTVPKRMVLFTLCSDEDFFRFIDVYKYWTFQLPSEKWLQYLLDYLTRFNSESVERSVLIDRLEGLVFYLDDQESDVSADGSSERLLDVQILTKDSSLAMKHVAGTGMLDLLKLMINNGFPLCSELLTVALVHGHVSMFDYLVLHKEVALPDNLPEKLMEEDRFDLMQMLWKDAEKYGEDTDGEFIMKKLIKRTLGPPVRVHLMFDLHHQLLLGPAQSHHTFLTLCVQSKSNKECAIFLLKNKLSSFASLVEAAGYELDMDLLNFLYAAARSGEMIEPTEGTISFSNWSFIGAAATAGRWDIIKFFHDISSLDHWMPRLLENVIQSGHVDCLRRLLDDNIISRLRTLVDFEEPKSSEDPPHARIRWQ